MKRLVLTFAVTAVTTAIVLALHLVDIRLNLAYALIFTLGALLARELKCHGTHRKRGSRVSASPLSRSTRARSSKGSPRAPHRG